MPLLPSAAVLALAGAVQWQAPAGCPEGAAVEDRVRALLGRVPDEHELRAVGVVSGGPPWQLELETFIAGRHQRRALSGPDCHAVSEAAALVLAVSLDPLGVARGEASSDRTARRGVPAVVPAAPQPAPAVAEPVAAPEAPASAQAPRPRPRADVRLRVGGGGETGAIPRGTGGVRLGVELTGARAFVQLDGTYWIDRFAALRREPTRTGAWVGLGTAAVRGGVRLGGTRVAVPLGLGLEAGGLRTRAVGLAGGRDLVLPWVAGTAGVGLEWAASPRVAVWGAAEGVVPLTRLRVRVGRGEDASGQDLVLHEPAAVGARVLAGLSIKIDARP